MTEYGEALVIRRDDGTVVVERADDVILVSKELLAEVEEHWYLDGVLTLDTAGEYRYSRVRTHDLHSDVFERIGPNQTTGMGGSKVVDHCL